MTCSNTQKLKDIYDVVVIGGGPGGYVAAIRAAQAGLATAVIEARDLGGTCLNRGCIPTKTVLHVTHLYKEMLHAHELGLGLSSPSYDMGKIHDKKDEVVQKLRDGICGLLDANQVDMYNAFGMINGNGSVTVTPANDASFDITAKNIIIATGATPFVPTIPGADLPGVITSDDLLEGPQEKIDSLIIVGGGVIGVEMASVYNNLGTKVTIIEGLERVLPLLDKEIGQSLSMSLKKRDIDIFTNAMLKEIKQDGSKLTAHFEDKKGSQMVTADKVLISTGRRANIKGLLADGLELNFDRGIVINDKYETNLPNVYAIGDCTAGSIQLAHAASAEATNVIAIITGNQPPMDMSLIPGCIYTSPEIATVGHTEASAKEAGISAKATKYITSGHAKSILEGHERGFIKLVFNNDNQTLIGAQLMCGRATDIISQLTLCIGKKLTAHEIETVIQPHPSFVEGVAEAAEALFGHAVHIAPAKKRA